ncbi:MAG: TIGR03960 family B12-binding radical SAM protein [Oscillospiraceae bacterium]|nr:TIGR03960 family B12-binding radical SAM protein [Oscillospiraceae bacterium]
MNEKLQRILPRVQKPARYVGGEYGQMTKDPANVRVRLGLCFPDTYEIAMSNLGIHILYGIFNGMDSVWCERIFAPGADMEAELREAGISLYGLESGQSAGEFDILGFSLGYEMSYTTVLNMLDLMGVPIRASEREGLSPLVIAGGTSCYNPEPVADFFDLFVLGEGEEVGPELVALYDKAKLAGWSKSEFLQAAAQIAGVYVPSLYHVGYNADGTIAAITPEPGAPERVSKRIVQDIDNAYFPAEGLVPSTEIVHDRVALELFRGCIRGCRFCQAGYIYRPVREKSRDTLVEQGKRALAYSGYQEATLLSLSTSDYRDLSGVCDGLLEFCEPRKIGLSLPSLRADNFSIDLMRRVQKVRKSSLTFAPEAGSQRLRDTINKNVTEEALLNSLQVAFSGGWSAVKLYFMLGLPTETDEDVVAIAELAHKILRAWKQHATNKNRGVRLTVSTSCFVPKAHSAFQWEAQVSMEEYSRRVALLKESLTSRAITYNWHEPETSFIEAVLSRGDRRLGPVIEHVWQNGGRLEGWSEHFNLDRWTAAFAATGIDPHCYANRERGEDEILPWAILDTGVDQSYLWQERQAAYAHRLTPDCRDTCTACGVTRLGMGVDCCG